MNIGPLTINFHRTVRVAEGRTSSTLPPNLGNMKLHAVKDYRQNCPASWDDNAYFAALHDVEACWISFTANDPLAVLVGAGGVNALSGDKLGTILEKDNYMVAPPQPWLDGWKDKDGTVYQFVATAHKKGEGLTVGEQLIGAESQTGALGIAVFQPKAGKVLKPPMKPYTSSYGGSLGTLGGSGQVSNNNFAVSCCYTATMDSCIDVEEAVKTSGGLMRMSARRDSTGSLGPSKAPVKEMGLGKGGKIVQKIYPDPYGLDVWQEKPAAVFALYLVDAATATAITGESVPAPKSSQHYNGPWFDLNDQQLAAVQGTDAFSGLKSASYTGLKSAAFPGDTSNAKAAK